MIDNDSLAPNTDFWVGSCTKIVSQTSREIKIAKDKGNWLTYLIFYILIFAILPSFPIGFFLVNILPSAWQTGVTTVICDRIEPKQVDCQISQSKFFDLVQQKTLSTKFVQTAKYAIVEKEDSEGKTTYTSKFSLVSKFGETPQFEISRDEPKRIVQSVNSFLASQQPSFKYVADERNFFIVSKLVFTILFNLGIAFVCFKFFLFFLQNGTEQEMLLNKPQGQITNTTKRFILGTTIEDYKFTDVAKIDALYAKDSYDNVSFKPRISMSSGKKYMLDVMSDRNAAIKLVNNLNQFIGLPEEEDPVVKE